MKLRNKRTGEIVDFSKGNFISSKDYGFVIYKDGGRGIEYTSLAEFNSEWEDYHEEPEVGFIIDPMEEDCISADDSGYTGSDVERAKELGIWFETEEEAERAVEKLKAYKRLRDKGFRFMEWTSFEINSGDAHFILCDGYLEDVKKDLDLLFGEDEE